MPAARDSNYALILLCFFLSGFAALLYQTAWTREFAFVFGTSDLAVAAVLAAYMGGLALGAAVAARIAPSLKRPVWVYGILELGIALCALAVPFGMRAISALTAVVLGGGETASDPGWVAGAFRLGTAFALLLPPTALMGATLPLLARHVIRTDAEVGPRIGALYSINTAGAIAGTLCAAFVLLPAIGLRLTVYSGAAINALVFVAAALVARRAPHRFDQDATQATQSENFTPGRWVLPLMTLSGAASFAYEVLWTRLLSQILGGSVYAFATMLASFLLGITVGSAIAGRLSKTRAAATAGFAWAQIGTAVLVLAAFAMADTLPDIAKQLGSSSMASPERNAALAGLVLLPFAICIGATFPFAVRIVTASAEASSAATARVYAWNTVGSILGSIGAGFFLLPWLGFLGMVTLGCGVNLALAAITSFASESKPRAPLIAAAVCAIALALQPVGEPWKLLRTLPMSGQIAEGDVAYYAVGRSSTVLLLDQGPSWRLMTNGLPESTLEKTGANPGGGVEARWLGFLGPLLHPNVERALVIGLGGGLALEGVPPDVDAIDVIELEHHVVEANRWAGPGRKQDPLQKPNARILVNDARGALMLSDTQYDSVVSQPSHPWTAGASHLYTREFFELVRDHMNQDGVFVQWIGISFVDEDLLKTLVATLGEVFKNVEVYNPVPMALLFAASNAPLDLTATGPLAIARAPEHFGRYGIFGVEDAAASMLLDSEGARTFAAGATLNTDDFNQLATRSARLGSERLNLRSLAALFGPHDPLLKIASRVSWGPFAKRLARNKHSRRLERIIPSLEPFERAIARGWQARQTQRQGNAKRQFETALRIRPNDVYAAEAIVAFGGTPDTHATPELIAAGKALELLRAENLAEIAAFDRELASFGPASPLFDKATRARVIWRLETKDTEQANEALGLIDRLIASGTSLPDYMLRARAAAIANRPDAVSAALSHVSQNLRPNARGRRIARQALGILQSLPGGQDHRLWPQFAKIAR